MGRTDIVATWLIMRRRGQGMASNEMVFVDRGSLQKVTFIIGLPYGNHRRDGETLATTAAPLLQALVLLFEYLCLWAGVAARPMRLPARLSRRG